jgi:hypothetical protein
MLAWHSSEPQLCRRVSSSKRTRCSLSDFSRAQRSVASSSSRRAIFRARPSASSQEEASAIAFSASALDIRSSASLSTPAAWSSTSLTRRVALSRAVVASRAEISMVSAAAARAASASTMTSCAHVTSTCNAGTSALVRDRSCRCKTQAKQVSIEEVIGTQTKNLSLFPD